MGSAALPPPPERPRMILRVSHDSGRTFGRPKRFYTRDCEPPPLNGCMPPCACPRCRPRKAR